MVARSWLVQVLHMLPQVFGLLKWHWLQGVSSWLVRVIPYSTLSWSTQSYRVRLRAVIFSNMDGIYRKMLHNQNVDVVYIQYVLKLAFYVHLNQETTF